MRTPKGPQITLDVTADIISSSRPRDSRHCMIAEALRTAYPAASKISVDLATIRFTDKHKGLRYTYLTPRLAQAALVQFDQKISPPPYQVKLRGAQVTRAHGYGKKLTPAEHRQRVKAAQKSAVATRARLALRHESAGTVPDRVGGKTPPLQMTDDKVPFSRRRAYGVRALQL